MIVECESCNAFVEARYHGAVTKEFGGRAPSVQFVLLSCDRCGSPIVVEQTHIGNEAEGDIWSPPKRLFPTSRYRANPSAPKSIQQAFDEAYTCYRSRAYTAAAILCRKTLEGICEAHGVRERSLMTSLKRLKEKGVIDERLFEWSDMLRGAGNDAAHDINVIISEADATDILEFTNAIVDYLFSYRERFEKFKARRTP